MEADRLQIIAINLTRRCNLACAHCYLDAEALSNPSDQELSTNEVKNLLDEIAENQAQAMVVLTGGEPLVRKDLEAISERGTQLGLMIVIGSNAAL